MAPLAGGVEPGHRALAGEFALEFGECAEDVKDQSAAGAGGVDRLGERAEADVAVRQVLHGAHQRSERSREAVEFPDDERVARAQEIESGLEFRPAAAGAGRGLGEDLFAAGAAQGADLQLGRLVAGRDPGVCASGARFDPERRGADHWEHRRPSVA